MTERERLIELLNKKYDHFCDQCGVNKDSCYTENLADYLLENNIKPLPFKINDIVYGISRGQIIPIQIDAIKYTSNGVDICGSNEEYFSYSKIHLDINNQIGMKWYKTKKEAEKALKGEAVTKFVKEREN